MGRLGRMRNDKRSTTTPFIIMAIIFFIILHLCFYYFKLNTSLNGSELIDTDTYMRLVRVEQLAETGDWYDSTIHRNNYPYGDTLHWTRPLDVLLIAGAAPLIPWLGVKKALLEFGIVFSPLIGILSILALVWATKPIIRTNAQPLLLIIFIGQPLLFQIFMFGRPDHHSLLVLLFILLIGSITHMLTNVKSQRYGILAGLLAAISTWISVEAIFPVIIVYAVLVILWIIYKDRYLYMLKYFSLSLLFFTSLSLLVERPLSDFFSAVEYDKISIVYIFVYLLAALYSICLSRIESQNWVKRSAWAAMLTIPASAAIWLVFPLFFHGPMAEINPAIVPIWLSKVSEVQPLLKSGYYFIISFLGPAGLALFYLIHLLKTKEKFNIEILLFFITAFIIFTALTYYQVRMAYCGLVIIAMISALMLDDIIRWLSSFPHRLIPLLRSAMIFLFILGFPAAGIAADIIYGEQSNYKNPDLPSLCQFLNEYQDECPVTNTVLANLHYGPQILYRTNFNIISAPYHRNDSGILFTYEVMTSDDMEKVKEMLNQRHIDLVVIAPDSNEKAIYDIKDNPAAFYERMKNNDIPDWGTQLTLPQDLQESFIIYRINS